MNTHDGEPCPDIGAVGERPVLRRTQERLLGQILGLGRVAHDEGKLAHEPRAMLGRHRGQPVNLLQSSDLSFQPAPFK